MKRLLSGNEAIAQGAWEAGVVVASAYPGTPSTEILEAFAKMPDVYAEWATNEKVALDVAVGAAYAGRRAMSCMKHVGLNVAADSYFYAAMTGIEAGLVIVTADDPEMHSSQNEQDNRRYAKFARVPCLEPSDSQEAKDMVGLALDLSEEFDTPVMLRPTTRISHSHTVVEVGARRQRTPTLDTYPRNFEKYVMLPINARRRHPLLEQRVERLSTFAETLPYNRMELRGRELGIVTCGVAYQYAREVFPEASILRLGMTYPLPRHMIAEFAGKVKRLIVVEELDPFLEEEIILQGIRVEGKSVFPMCGELDSQVVRESAIAAGILPESARIMPSKPIRGDLPQRPPVLCPGCPHRGVFFVMKKLKLPVQGDIGCYTLGGMPPLSNIDTCGCMGAGIGVAHGADKAGDAQRHIAVIGDSTFFHTGMPALLNTVYNRGKSITVIMDNRVTAMTGHQHNPGTGYTLQGVPTPEIELEPLVKAMGVDHIHTVDAYDLAGLQAAFHDSVNIEAPSVIVTRRECALLPQARREYLPLRVDLSKCVACWSCFRLGCPAIRRSNERFQKTGREKSDIDPLLCTGCEVCAQVCPQEAILFRAQVKEEASQPSVGEA